MPSAIPSSSPIRQSISTSFSSASSPKNQAPILGNRRRNPHGNDSSAPSASAHPHPADPAVPCAAPAEYPSESEMPSQAIPSVSACSASRRSSVMRSASEIAVSPMAPRNCLPVLPGFISLTGRYPANPLCFQLLRNTASTVRPDGFLLIYDEHFSAFPSTTILYPPFSIIPAR